MRQLSRCFPFLVALALVFSGCDSTPTAPNSNQVQTPNARTANAGGPPGGTPGGGTGPACDVTVSPGESINTAIDDAASGDVVCVESGTYTEQVTINKDLTLKGLNNPTIEIPSDPADFTIPESSGSTWEPGIFAFGGTQSGGDVSGSGTVDVTVKGFNIDGGNLSSAPGPRALAVFYRNAIGTVSSNSVNGMPVGGRETFGILAYGDSDVDITSNTVDDYERGGIGANGNGGIHPSPEVVISGNTLIGSGQGNENAWAANGIQVGFGATGQVTNNVVKNSRWAKFDDTAVEDRKLTDFRAACILVFESDGIKVRNNEVSNCDVGLSVGAWGLIAPSGNEATADNTKIVGNQAEDAGLGVLLEAVGGVEADASVSNTKVVRNELTGGLDTNTPGKAAIVLSKISISPSFTQVLQNNKMINNQIRNFNREIVDEGGDTKAHANDRPFIP